MLRMDRYDAMLRQRKRRLPSSKARKAQMYEGKINKPDER